jgi:hypothetical protein
MRKNTAADVLTVGELARIANTSPRRIEAWCCNGIIVPDEDANGFGSRRSFRGAIPILDATEARELTFVGYNSRQILRRFAVHRANLVGLRRTRRSSNGFAATSPPSRNWPRSLVVALATTRGSRHNRRS